MSTAIITLSKAARDLALKIKQTNNSYCIYTMPKYQLEGTELIDGKFSSFVGDIFNKYDTLIFIMATGIVVRSIAPYLKHKSLDPAVLVVDNKAQYVISLLSGHLGGANEKAEQLAKEISATAIITTASDLNHKLAVDMFAKQNNLVIKDFNNAKLVTSLIINEEQVGILTDFALKRVLLPHNVKIIKSINNDINGLIYITNKQVLPQFSGELVQLIKPNIVIGIGCKKGIEANHVINTVYAKLKQLNLANEAVVKIASVDIKKNEPAILELAKKLGVSYITYSVKELNEVEHLFEISQFVKKTIGVGTVCEAAGYLASQQGECLVKKEKHSGVTLSIWQEGVKK